MDTIKTLDEFQKEQAIACFNKTWEYIDKVDRTPEETLEMIHTAHASRYLWGQVGKPLHFERGEWQISKVYFTAGHGERALYHGKACLKICQDHDIKDFDIAFAYEAIANAYKLLDDQEQVSKYKDLAFACLEGIKDDGDREYTESELKKI